MDQKHFFTINSITTEKQLKTTTCRFPSKPNNFNDLGANYYGHKRTMNSTTEEQKFNPMDVRNTAAAERNE